GIVPGQQQRGCRCGLCFGGRAAVWWAWGSLNAAVLPRQNWMTAESRFVSCARGTRVVEVEALNAGREAERRPLPAGTVTFLLTDVEGSTPRWDRDPEGMAAVIDRHEVILHGTIDRHRGVRPVEQGEGDSVVAVFERAADAIAAALDAQLALSAERWPEGLEVRVR